MNSKQKSAAPALDPKSIKILTYILKATWPSQRPVDAVHYRAKHHAFLSLLDKLENDRYLRQENEKYFLTLFGLSVLGNSLTRPIFTKFENIFSILRTHYEKKPRDSVKIRELAKAARLKLSDTIGCLQYMKEGSWWSNYPNDPTDKQAVIRAHERALNYRTFREITDEVVQLRRTEIQNKTSMTKSFLIDDLVRPSLTRANATHIIDAWEKAVARRLSDPEGAITSARTLLETICKYILDETGTAYDDKHDLPQLYKLTAEQLDLVPGSQHSDILKQILGSCQSVITGLGSMRNRFGDSHGRGKMAVTPAPRHAELAVNLAGTMSMFLMETWEARKRP